MEQIRDGVGAIESQFGKIDILVNNAGINRPMAGFEVTQENWDDHYNTNIKGGFFIAQARSVAIAGTLSSRHRPCLALPASDVRWLSAFSRPPLQIPT